MNLGIFGGRLGKDAELNRLQGSGDAVCNFSIAVDIGTKTNPKTMWIECALFGKRGEGLHQYLLKGTKVTVSGRVSLDEFTGRDGQKKTAMRLTLSEIDLHGNPTAGDRQPAAATSYDRPRAAAPAGAAAPTKGHADDMDDDIPF
jgi:single-strand DNA-binding protein